MKFAEAFDLPALCRGVAQKREERACERGGMCVVLDQLGTSFSPASTFGSPT